jgi:hypothetical protein
LNEPAKGHAVNARLSNASPKIANVSSPRSASRTANPIHLKITTIAKFTGAAHILINKLSQVAVTPIGSNQQSNCPFQRKYLVDICTDLE